MVSVLGWCWVSYIEFHFLCLCSTLTRSLQSLLRRSWMTRMCWNVRKLSTMSWGWSPGTNPYPPLVQEPAGRDQKGKNRKMHILLVPSLSIQITQHLEKIKSVSHFKEVLALKFLISCTHIKSKHQDHEAILDFR